MRLSKILVPIDFSASSTAAVEYATMLAQGSGAPWFSPTSLFLPLILPHPPDSAEGRPYALPSQQDPGEATLDKVVPTAYWCDPSRTSLLSGDPADELLDLAAREQVELIVMGTHGHTALSKLLLGSVAEAVVKRATCPVITLRLPRRDIAKLRVNHRPIAPRIRNDRTPRDCVARFCNRAEEQLHCSARIAEGRS